MTTFFLVIIALAAYFIGGVNGSIIASKYFFKKDVRRYGSKNAGLTNFYRTFGGFGIALVLGIDILKSVLAVLIGGWLLGTRGYPEIGQLFAGFCLILGHSYPAYYGLRGGKGVLCGVIVMLLTDWRVGVLCLLAFFVVVVFTRYVSLGSLIGTLCAPLGMIVFGHEALAVWITLFCVIVIVFNHRNNILRLIQRTESRLNFGKKENPPL